MSNGKADGKRKTGSNCLKGESFKVIVHEKGIKDSWKEYIEKMMNEETEWDHGISAEVKEGPADCTRIGVAALKKMKRHKAPGLSGLSAEMIQATEGIGTHWLFMVALWNREDHIYFHDVVCSFFFLLFFFPCLISAAADWMSAILPHMVWP